MPFAKPPYRHYEYHPMTKSALRKIFTRGMTGGLTLAMLVVLAVALRPTGTYAEPDLKAVPSGTYQLDPNHTSITFKINHLGFSYYTGRFDKMEGTLNYNSAAPEQSALQVTIYPNSIDTNNGKLEEELRTDKWFNVIQYPRAAFQSMKIERTGPTTGKLTGEFTLMGQTHELALDVTLVGAGENMMLKKPVLGFSAVGTLKRSDYGLTNLIPLVGDDVKLEIEAEFDKVD
jgi:polyisoprenoid-binding protein YceI